MDFKRFKLTRNELMLALQERPCVKCGACCRGYSIEIQEQDAIREPNLLNYATPWQDIPEKQNHLLKKSPWVIITDDKSHCPFLDENSRCRTYPTRPQICRSIIPTYLTCHASRLEERGLMISNFLQDILIRLQGNPYILAGLIFAIDFKRVEKAGIIKGVTNKKISLKQLIDYDYFQLYRKCNLSGKLNRAARILDFPLAPNVRKDLETIEV